MRSLPHEIANGRLKRQTSAQRGEKLPTAAVTLQDFSFGDWERDVPALKLRHGIDQGKIGRQGLDGTSHDVGNGESSYGRISRGERGQVFVGLTREQRMLQLSLQRSKRLSEAGEIPRLDNDQVQRRFRLDRRSVCAVRRAFKNRRLPEMVALRPRHKWSLGSFIQVKPGAPRLDHEEGTARFTFTKNKVALSVVGLLKSLLLRHVHLHDVGLEENIPSPIHDHIELALEGRDLQQVDSSPQEPS